MTQLALFWKKYQDLGLFQVADAAIISIVSTLALGGCGLTINNPALSSGQSTTPSAPGSSNSTTQIHGHVGSAQWPVSNSSIQLYAVGEQGAASRATPLLSQPVLSDTNGVFSIVGGYTCPSSSSQLYLVATGGNPSLTAGTNNRSLALMTVLGTCSGLSSTTTYPINEVTTVGSIWPLAPYMSSAIQLGSASSDASFSSALVKISQLVNLTQAVSPGIGVPTGYAVQTAKLYTLSDDLHGCVASSGGEAGDGSICSELFSLTTSPAGSAPHNTIDAALRLAQTNQLSVDALFQFLPQNSPYRPVLTAVPMNWNLNLVPIPAAPVITPTAGAYDTGQLITLSDGTAGASIYYTLDGTVPTTTSFAYSAPFLLASPKIVSAIAVTEDVASGIATAVYTVNPASKISVSPATATLSALQTQQFVASAAGSSNSGFNWAIQPPVGSVSKTGLYTAPPSISASQAVTISATSSAQPGKSASATINLTPPQAVISASITPGHVDLAPSQSQLFTVTVAGTSTQGIAWTVSPSIGSITAGGLYTAPSSILGLQDITVTATSVADPTKSAAAGISLTPGGPGNIVYYVDNVSGRDANDGTTPSTPWATVAKVNSISLQAGQTVAFKAGDSWHEMLMVSQSGNQSSPITYTSYGTGSQPLIDASDTVTGWTRGGSASAPGLPPYVWFHSQAASPLLIDFSGAVGTPVSNSAAVAKTNQFAWDGSTLFVYSTTDPTEIVEVAARPSALISSGAGYITVSNLELRGGTDTVYCGGSSPCAAWDFESNTIDSAGAVGLRWLPSPGVSGAKLTVNNNVIRGTGSSGVGVSNGGSALGDIISNNTLTDLCKIYIGGSPENTYCDAIYVYSATGTDGGGQIVYNTITQVGLQSGAAYGGGIHADTVLNWGIEHNTVSNTNYPGVTLEKGSGSTARYNLLIDTGQYPYFSGLFIRAGDGLNVANMTAEYNTVVGGFWACALGVWMNEGAVSATNITMSRNICTGADSKTQFWLDPGFAAAGNTFLANGFGVSSAGFVDAANVAYGSYALLPSPIDGSLSGDPQFVSPTTGDYHLLSTSPDFGIGAFPTP